MALSANRETSNGRTYIVERIDGVVIRRIPVSDPPPKEAAEDRLRAMAMDLLLGKTMLQEATARGESATALNELSALVDVLYARCRAEYLEWRAL